MPRPTRSRVAAARRANAEAWTPSEPTPPALSTSIVVADDTPKDAPHSIPSDETDIYGISDREIERQRQARQDTVSLAADATVTLRTTTRRSTRTRTHVQASTASAALSTTRARRDEAMARLNDLTSTTAASAVTSPVREIGRNGDVVMDASSLLGGGSGIRVGGGGAGGRDLHNLSGLEINDSEIFGNLDNSLEDETLDGGERSAVQSGARSADTSAFNVSVFRRQSSRTRGRRRSIVGKDDAPIRPSSRGPTTPGLSSTFSLGNFKRRQRQPSILLSSAQKASVEPKQLRGPSAASGDEGVHGNEHALESDMEDSFLPEAEGTPIRASRGMRNTGDAINSHQEQSDGGRETRSRKRKSTESHDIEAAKRQAVEQEEEDNTIHQSVEMDEPPSSPPSFIARRRRVTPESDDAILAPPASSSSRETSPSAWPSLSNLGRRQRGRAPSRLKTPALDDDTSDLSEPPSLTHSPNYNATKAAPPAKKKESPIFSTADLKAMLPRRRKKAPVDGDDDVEDEENSSVGYEELPRRTAKKKTTKPGSGVSKAKELDEAVSLPLLPKRSTRRKYGSRRFERETTLEGESIEAMADESMPLDDTAFEADVNDETTLDLSDELKAASKKFKEVDKWKLDFEEVVEPSSDLPEGR
ncbi:hypothetical protein BD289DRAFT_285690 [Coniella lustricola]|uniref:Uncharacterized protein n=1 Tax=Coniella lustricola TaxID=2025994 RepID=A0A2T3AKE9_9PEZI|nr:hypothetical protein BD289DRAFT_285690 [Coniella lustricola]